MEERGTEGSSRRIIFTAHRIHDYNNSDRIYVVQFM